MKPPSTDLLADTTLSGLRRLLALAGSSSEDVESRVAAESSSAVRQHIDDLARETGRSGTQMLDLTARADTPIAVFTDIKNEAKRLFERSRTDQQRHAAMILYHAAIAGAYAFRGASITSAPMSAVIGVYEDLAIAFQGDSLATVFAKAVSRHEMSE